MGSRLPLGEGLRAELGEPRRVRRLSSSPRSQVWRAELSGTPVVVKQLVGGPEADEGYAREVAALRLASRVDPPVVPMLLGTDPGERVLVLEYLDHKEPGEEWLIDYATALARLHAAPADETRGELPAWSGPTSGDIESFLTLAKALGVVAPPGVRAELEGLAERLARAPGRTALLHGDPCPGNDMHTDSGVRFIDFEQASLGEGAVELAYLRIGFPTCWCATAPPPALLEAAEHAYRAVWREATGTEVPGDLTDACAGWLLRGDALVQRAQRGATDYLDKVPRRDWKWGTATARQRLVHRLQVVGRMATDSSELKESGQLASAMRESTLTRWPALQPLPPQRP